MRFLHDSGVENTFLGLNAGTFTASGSWNTATGHAALTGLTTGFGWELQHRERPQRARGHTISSANTAVGADALGATTTGSGSTAVGGSALLVNTVGAANHARTLGADVEYDRQREHRARRAGLGSERYRRWQRRARRRRWRARNDRLRQFLHWANVFGNAAGTNTIRIGLSFNGATGKGQSHTFVAGTRLTGSAGRRTSSPTGSAGL